MVVVGINIENPDSLKKQLFLSDEKYHPCSVANKWISQRPFVECDCQEKDNCTHLPQNYIYCHVTEVARKNCPNRCEACPTKGLI